MKGETSPLVTQKEIAELRKRKVSRYHVFRVFTPRNRNLLDTGSETGDTVFEIMFNDLHDGALVLYN